jgi:CBS domain-containing protein
VTAGAGELGSELMLTMVDEGVRHLPIRSNTGEILGVVTDRDLLAAEARAPLVIRRAIAEARDLRELRAAVGRLLPAVVALHDAHVGPQQVGAIMAAVVDAAVRRLIELRLREAPLPPFSWLSLGSFGRREPMPSSDLDSGLVWAGDAPERPPEFADKVGDELERVGFRRDMHGATAAGRIFARSTAEWRAAIADWLEHPGREKVLIAVSLLADARVVAGDGEARDVLGMLTEARNHPALLSLLKRLALAQRPPTGFLRDIVVEHGGEHSGHFDIKRGGLLPIVDIARYAAMAAGAAPTATTERLQAASHAGTLKADRARTLKEALDLFAALRLEHQVEQLRRAEPPDNFVEPKSLNQLTRRYLREAFREVAAVQRQLSSSLVFE